MYSLSRVLALMTTLFVAACLPAGTRPSSVPSPRPEVTLIEVSNNNFEDLVVYWRKGEVDIALGVATGMTTRRFIITPAMLGDGLGIRLAIGPRGQPAAQVSSLFNAAPRAMVSWIVDYRLGTSSVVVR